MSASRLLARLAPFALLLAVAPRARAQGTTPGTATPGTAAQGTVTPGVTPPVTTGNPPATQPGVGAAVAGTQPPTTAGGGVPGQPGGLATASPATEGAGSAQASGAVAGQALTADLAAARAVQTSVYVATDEARLRAAAAQVDAAWDQYWPRLTLTARYTRLSPITLPTLGGPPGTYSVVAVDPPGAPGTITPNQPLPANYPLIATASGFRFPVILDQYLAQASLLIPVSDYVFKIYKQHESALASYEAAKWNAKVTTATAATDARVAFYNVLRARGSVVVAKAAVAQSEAHLKDMKNRLEAKTVTIADVARVEANLAAAQLAVIRSENLVVVTEANLRVLMHATGEEPFSLGEDLDAEISPFKGDLPTLKATAFSKRPELKAIDAQIEAQSKNKDVVAANMYPRLDGIGNFTYANPNQRFIPQTKEFKATWDVSIQLTWSPNDALIAHDNKKIVAANIGVLKATREQIVDGLTLDVVNAYTRVKEAEAAIATTRVELKAAEEAYRVRKEQFALGATTSALLIDAEADLTRARLNHLNARVDLRVARAQLKKSIGEV